MAFDFGGDRYLATRFAGALFGNVTDTPLTPHLLFLFGRGGGEQRRREWCVCVWKWSMHVYVFGSALSRKYLRCRL